MSNDINEVTAIEKRFWSNANDPAFYQEAMAREGISVIEPMGFVEKAKAVEYAKAGKPYRDVVFKDLVARQPSPDCIVLAYHGEGRAEGEETLYQGSIASVYVKRDGRWQMTLTVHQAWKPEAAKK